MSAVWAVIAAGGRGARFGGDVPKQYLRVHGRTLLEHSLQALRGIDAVRGVVVATPADDVLFDDLVFPDVPRVHRCIGGRERADSVLAGIDALRSEFHAADDDIVLVHDAARPNVHADDLAHLVEVAMREADGALLAAPVRDTLKCIDADGRSAATHPRDGLWRALTPQAARIGTLRDAIGGAIDAGITVTDEAMALERSGRRPVLVEGRDDNIKVTTPADLAIVSMLLARRAEASR